MAYPNVPHFQMPFHIGPDGSPSCVEQDTVDDVAQCVLAIIKTPVGTFPDLPAFGTPELLFHAGIDSSAFRATVERWEPRAKATFDVHPDMLDEMILDVAARVGVR